MKLRLDFFTLKTRIFLGFTGFGLLFALLSLIFWGRLQSQISEYRNLEHHEKQRSLHRQIEQGVREVQYQAQLYTYQGYPSSVKNLRDLLEHLRGLTQEAMGHNRIESIDPRLKTIAEILLKYDDHIREVVRERQNRDHLKGQALSAQLEALKLHLSQARDRHPALRALENLVFLNVRSAEKEILNYLDSLDALHVDHSLEYVDEALALLPRGEIEELHGQLKNFKSLIISIVQSTRAYLYLVNVVMAADTNELAHQAKNIEKTLSDLVSAKQSSMVLRQQQAVLLMLGLSFVALLTMLIVSWLLGMSIVRPLGLIKETFNRLASGEKLSNIPAMDYRDEVGELARSANVFKERNELTQKLLNESQQMTLELEAKRAELARSNDEMEQFVFTVSHDLKSPLVTSMGYVGMIKELAAQEKFDQVVLKLDRVSKANERMALLISDLLELSRVGRVDIELEEVSLVEMLSEIEVLYEPKLIGEEMKLQYSKDLPSIVGNRSRIMQVLENLIGNAIKYGRSSSKEHNIVEVSCEKVNGGHQLMVRDHGEGIAQEFQEKVFGLFTRLNQDKDGTGIGLAVVKKVMSFHGGTVWIESPEDGGVRFCLFFPDVLKN